MHTLITTFFALSALPLLAADGRTDPAIEKTAEAYRKAVLSGDAAAVAATYRDDAVEMPPCHSLLRGRQAIEQYYRELFSAPMKISDFSFTHLETVSAGNFGYTTGTYKQKLSPKSGEPVEDSGNFVVIVKRDGGVWKSAYVIYNSHRPQSVTGSRPPAPAAGHKSVLDADSGSLWSFLQIANSLYHGVRVP